MARKALAQHVPSPKLGCGNQTGKPARQSGQGGWSDRWASRQKQQHQEDGTGETRDISGPEKAVAGNEDGFVYTVHTEEKESKKKRAS